MRITVIGSGAIGSLYGGWLLAAGADVAFVARGSRFDQLERDGLVICGDAGNLSFPHVTLARNRSEEHTSELQSQ